MDYMYYFFYSGKMTTFINIYYSLTQPISVRCSDSTSFQSSKTHPGTFIHCINLIYRNTVFEILKGMGKLCINTNKKYVLHTKTVDCNIINQHNARFVLRPCSTRSFCAPNFNKHKLNFLQY
jgi:hypothetical protein